MVRSAAHSRALWELSKLQVHIPAYLGLTQEGECTHWVVGSEDHC